MAEVYDRLNSMRKPAEILFLTLAVLLGSIGVSESGDIEKAVTAYKLGDYETAFSELKPLAEQGYADSQGFLGWMYQNGLGVSKDYKIRTVVLAFGSKFPKIFH